MRIAWVVLWILVGVFPAFGQENRSVGAAQIAINWLLLRDKCPLQEQVCMDISQDCANKHTLCAVSVGDCIPGKTFGFCQELMGLAKAPYACTDLGNEACYYAHKFHGYDPDDPYFDPSGLEVTWNGLWPYWVDCLVYGICSFPEERCPWDAVACGDPMWSDRCYHLHYEVCGLSTRVDCLELGGEGTTFRECLDIPIPVYPCEEEEFTSMTLQEALNGGWQWKVDQCMSLPCWSYEDMDEEERSTYTVGEYIMKNIYPWNGGTGEWCSDTEP